MGLFNMFKGNKSATETKPLEVYLAQRPTHIITKCGRDCLGLTPATDNGIWMHIGREIRYFYDFEKPINNCEKIPKCYRDTYVKPDMLFSIAYDNDSSEAAFYLGVMYEHGISVEQDQGTANQYFSDALNRPLESGSKSKGQYFTEALEFIKHGNLLKNPSFTNNQGEELAMTLFCLNIEDEKSEKVKSILNNDPNWMDEFIRLGVILVGFYASKGYPYSMFNIGGFMHSSGIEEPYLKNVFEFYPEDTVKAAGKCLIDKVYRLAKNGNRFAINCIN